MGGFNWCDDDRSDLRCWQFLNDAGDDGYIFLALIQLYHALQVYSAGVCSVASNAKSK